MPRLQLRRGGDVRRRGHADPAAAWPAQRFVPVAEPRDGDIALGNLLSAAGGARYTVGWYACRRAGPFPLPSCCSISSASSCASTGSWSNRRRARGAHARARPHLERLGDLLGVSNFEGYFLNSIRPGRACSAGARTKSSDACRPSCAIPTTPRSRTLAARGSPRASDGANGEPLPPQGRLLALDRLDDDRRPGLIYVAGRRRHRREGSAGEPAQGASSTRPRRRWRRWASSPAASRTTSTIS